MNNVIKQLLYVYDNKGLVENSEGGSHATILINSLLMVDTAEVVPQGLRTLQR